MNTIKIKIILFLSFLGLNNSYASDYVASLSSFSSKEVIGAAALTGGAYFLAGKVSSASRLKKGIFAGSIGLGSIFLGSMCMKSGYKMNIVPYCQTMLGNKSVKSLFDLFSSFAPYINKNFFCGLFGGVSIASIYNLTKIHQYKKEIYASNLVLAFVKDKSAKILENCQHLLDCEAEINVTISSIESRKKNLDEASRKCLSLLYQQEVRASEDVVAIPRIKLVPLLQHKLIGNKLERFDPFAEQSVRCYELLNLQKYLDFLDSLKGCDAVLEGLKKQVDGLDLCRKYVYDKASNTSHEVTSSDSYYKSIVDINQRGSEQYKETLQEVTQIRDELTRLKFSQA